MPEISLKTIDALHRTFIRLDALTSMQTLLRNDFFENTDAVNHSREYACDLLFDLQTETVSDLRALLFSDPFC